jgi:transposase
MRGTPFDIETYIRSVESYTVGRKSVDEIVRETGMSEATLFNKLREFRKKGRIDPPKPKPGLKRTEQVCNELVELKKAHPNYGKTRLSRELAKVHGQRLSDATTAKVLRELNLQLPPKRGDSTKQKSRHNYKK